MTGPRLHGTQTSDPKIAPPSLCSPAQAFWKHREWLEAELGVITQLSSVIAHPSDFDPYQWAQIATFTADFRPDLILELGRGFGNSTACFTHVANYLGGAGACRVLSLCRSDEWEQISLPKLKEIVPPDWFAPTDARRCNILACNIEQELGSAKRIVVFWDAHGFEVAEWVLGELLPKIASMPHLVIMHDLSDVTYLTISREYGTTGLWKGKSGSDPTLMYLGNICSRVAQAISIIDFSTRNRLPLYSAEQSFQREVVPDANKTACLERMLGELFQTHSHWFWFTLMDVEQKITFPRFTPPLDPDFDDEADKAQPEADLLEARTRIRELHESVVGWEKINWDLRMRLEAIENSAGWRLLSRWRALREAVVPPGTVRGRLYEAIKASLVRRSR